MFPSAFQDMHARMPALSCAAERASPGGLKTHSAIHEQHCGARGFSSTVQAMPPWRTSCLRSTSLFLQQVTSIHEEVQEHCVRWGLWHFDTGSTSLAQRAGRHESRHRCDRAASSLHEIRQRCLHFQLRRFMRRPTSEITSCSARGLQLRSASRVPTCVVAVFVSLATAAKGPLPVACGKKHLTLFAAVPARPAPAVHRH